MRMSSTVKDYIKDCIASKYSLKDEPKRWDEVEKMYEEIRKECQPILAKIIKKYADKVYFYRYSTGEASLEEFIEDSKISCNNSRISAHDKEYEEIKDYNEAVKAKRAKAYRDIIVAMELGGNKEDLDRMLANLPD